MTTSHSYLETLLSHLNPLDLFENIESKIEHALESSNATTGGFIRDTQLLNELAGDNWNSLPEGTNIPLMRRQYMASFVLRHSATWIATAWEWVARRQPWLRLPAHDKSPYSPLQSDLKSQVLKRKSAAFQLSLDSPVPYAHLSLSARGLEWRLIPRGICSYFDPYSPVACMETSGTSGGYCLRHGASDLFTTESPSEEIKKNSVFGQSRLTLRHSLSQRDTMIEFYADFQNLNAYNNEELEELIASFWKRFKGQTQIGKETTMSLEQAAILLGYDSLHGAARDSPTSRKARFRQLAKKVHPDCGGRSEDFIDLQKAHHCLEEHFNQGQAVHQPTWV